MGFLEDTAVIFTSDHGTELWDKQKFGKSPNRLHRYNTGIPLIIRLPGGRDGGTRRGDLVQHQDFFPTICGLMGYEPDADLGLDGWDIFDSLAFPPETVITAWGPNVSVRDLEWNMIIDSTGEGDRRELYDLRDDPDESNNVYDANPEVVREFTAFLEASLGPLPYAIRHRGDRRQAPPLIVRYRKS